MNEPIYLLTTDGEVSGFLWLGEGAVMNNVATNICISVIVGVASFQRGMREHPTTLPSILLPLILPRVNRLEKAWSIKKKWNPCWGTSRPPHCKAKRLPETSLYLTFPSQLRPARRSEQKVRGQEREACVYFLVSMALGKLYLGWSVGYAGWAPCCHGPLV